MDNFIMVGTVSSINIEDRTARVEFADKKDVSGKPFISAPLKVLINTPFIPARGENQQTEETEDLEKDDFGDFRKHSHDLDVKLWMPEVGEFVLCLYLANGESDGFILGSI